MKRDEIVAEARSWIGTPYHHQAALKGVGCDCIGIIRGVYEQFCGAMRITADYSPQWHLHRSEEVLYAHACQYGEEIPLEAATLGDVLLFGFHQGPAAHAGIITSTDTMIHAYAEVGKVVETRLTDKWLNRRRASFQFPGIE